MSFPAHYQLPSFVAYAKSGTRDLDIGATTADFRAIATTFHNEFFAEHPDTETFTSVVKLMLAKIYDERQRRPGEQYEFQVLQMAGKEETAASLFKRLEVLYIAAYTAYIDPTGGDAIDAKVFAPERVKSVVKGLQGLAITRGAALHGDVIGAFFEEIVRTGFKQDKGMYFTHTNLVWFMLEGLDLTGLTKKTWKNARHPNDRMPYLIDPSCGSGAFLLRSMQVMSSAIRDDKAALVQTQDDVRYFDSHLSDSNPNEWATDFLYGSDPKFVMAITAKVNMVLHGDGSAHILKWDSLKPLAQAPDRRLHPLPAASRSVPESAYSPEVSEQFDVVVSNPPFGITLAPETQKAAATTFSLGGATPSESLFLERYVQLLKPLGRLAVVVPESLLNASDFRESRLLLYRFFHVRAVVSLPRNLFVETPTLTSLLFAQKKTAAETASWDATWEKHASAVTAAVAKAKADVKKAARVSGASGADVELAFVKAVGSFIPKEAFIRKKGRKSQVFPAVIPPGMSAILASEHYEQFLKASGIAQLKNEAVLKLMLQTHDYDWPAYAVDEVGFKLSKRGERIRPNQLLRFEDANGTVRANVQMSDTPAVPVIDVNSPSYVLDFMRRDVKWA